MPKRTFASNLGIYAYAAGAIFLGVLGLATGDFATNWQRVVPTVPFREPLAYLTASIELAAGLALLWRRSARVGALTLTVVYSVFALLWVPKMLEPFKDFDPTGNFFEEFSLVVGGLVLFSRLSGRDGAGAEGGADREAHGAFGDLIRGGAHLRHAGAGGCGAELDSAFAGVLGVRDYGGVFPGGDSDFDGDSGSAGDATADGGDCELRVVLLASEADGRPSGAFCLGGECDFGGDCGGGLGGGGYGL